MIERERLPEGVKQIPEAPAIPEHIERRGVQAPPQFSGQVVQDGQSLMTPSGQEATTITLPGSPEVLADRAKGDIANSSTWWARFWLRMIKLARHFSWKILSRSQST